LDPGWALLAFIAGIAFLVTALVCIARSMQSSAATAGETRRHFAKRAAGEFAVFIAGLQSRARGVQRNDDDAPASAPEPCACDA
jgi:hypothetical protein